MENLKKASLLLSGSLIFTNAYSTPKQEEKNPPNILLIVAEDMSRDAGCYGNTFLKTPNLDKLANEGILFENAYTTQASCSPSRSSIFTGLYPHENGQIGLVHENYLMHRNIPNMIGNLKKLGYYTIQLGKVHVDAEKEYPFDYQNSKMVNDPYFYKKETEKIFSTMPDSPFFMLVSLKDAHSLESGRYEIPEGYDSTHIISGDKIKLPSWFGGLTSDAMQPMLLGYYNAVLRVDHAVGLIQEELIKKGIEKNTIVIFMSDHGSPLLRSKCTIYESGLAIPFIVKWPEMIKPGQKSDALISVTDIFPTIMDITGGEVPFPAAGKSILPICKGEKVKWRDHLYGEWNSDTPGHFNPQRSIRDHRYKLIENTFPGKPKFIIFDSKTLLETNQDIDLKVQSHYKMLLSPPKFELYDLQNDPNEFINLADDQAFKKIKDQLLIKLREWQNKTNDYLTCDKTFLSALTKMHSKKDINKTDINLAKYKKDWKDVLQEYK